MLGIHILATFVLWQIKQNLYQCPQDVKEAAHKGFVCPVLEYGSCVWVEIKKVQNRNARFVTSNYCYETGSMTGILEN